MSTTQLRHIKAPSLEDAEKILGSLPRKVEIKSISYAPVKTGAAPEWIIHFTVDDWVVSTNDIMETVKNKDKLLKSRKPDLKKD